MKEVFTRLYWAFAVLRSRAFVIATDKQAVAHIKINNPESMKNIMLLGSQQSALETLRDHLDEAIKDHEAEVENLYKQKEA